MTKFVTGAGTNKKPKPDGCKEIPNYKDFIYVKIGKGRYYKANIEKFCRKKSDGICGRKEIIGINTFDGNTSVSNVSLLPSIIFRSTDGGIDIEEMNRLLTVDGDKGWKQYLNTDGTVPSGNNLKFFHGRYNIEDHRISTTPLEFNVVKGVPSYRLKANWLKEDELED